MTIFRPGKKPRWQERNERETAERQAEQERRNAAWKAEQDRKDAEREAERQQHERETAEKHEAAGRRLLEMNVKEHESLAAANIVNGRIDVANLHLSWALLKQGRNGGRS
jgi:molecular chaperone GrpE (heat shock protein)